MIVDIVDIIKIVIGGICVGLASSVTVGPVAVLCIQRTLSRGYFSGIFSGLGVASADTLMAILAFSLYALLKEYIDKYNTIIMICGGIFVIIVGIFIFFKNPVPQVRKNRTDKNELWQDFASMFGFTLANFAIVIPYILAFFTMFNIDLTYTDNSKPTPVEIVADETPQRGTAELNYIEDDDTSLYNLKEADGQTVAQEAEQIAAHEAEEIAKAGIELPKMLRNILILGGFLVGAMIWWVALASLINLFRRNFRPRHLITINRIAGIIISALGTYTLLSVVINF
jgi:threonine/homoserine/homoserine lactone efflux protein